MTNLAVERVYLPSLNSYQIPQLKVTNFIHFIKRFRRRFLNQIFKLGGNARLAYKLVI